MQKKVFTYAPITKVDDVLFNIHHHFVIENVIEHDHDNCIEITIVSEGNKLCSKALTAIFSRIL